MFLNNREKSRELIYYEVLSRRTVLSKEEQWRFQNLMSGFAGEAEYDKLFNVAGHGRLLIYRDLWLKIDKAVLQADNLIVADGTLVVNEIKNYSGNYVFDGSGWFRSGRPSGEDPLAQVSRTAGKLVRLGYHLPYRVNIEKKVVFINPNLDLEINSDENAQFIVGRPRLLKYFAELNQMYAGHAAEENARALGKFIIDDPMELPVTVPNRVRRGNYCYECGSYELVYGKFKVKCCLCACSETVERMFVRAIIDFAILFYGESLTTPKIFDFVGKRLSERSVRRLLNKYCDKTGTNRDANYIPKSLNLEKLLEISGYQSRYEKQKN